MVWLGVLGLLVLPVLAAGSSTGGWWLVPGTEPVRAADRLDVAGTFSPSDKISVANLTVTPHEYVIAITFDARLIAFGVPNTLNCGVIDNNGFRRFFLRDEKPIRSFAGWERHTIIGRVALPDLTMGLRCVPERAALISAHFRAIRFVAVEIDHSTQGAFGSEGFGRSVFG